MKKMTSASAMKIIHYYSGNEDLSEDEEAELIEALEYMLENEPYVKSAWMFNLAGYYDRIGKYDLAVKYYEMCIAENDPVGYLGLGGIRISICGSMKKHMTAI